MNLVCPGCEARDAFLPAIAFAFQPILDVEAQRIFAFEALVRGAGGEGAGTVLAAVTSESRYSFDQACRTTAIAEAARLGLPETGALLSINFLPNAVYEPRNCLRATLRAAERVRFPLSALMFEVTEGEKLDDPAHLRHVVEAYQEMGFTVAIDDFGAGHSGLSLLADFQPDIIKLDMGLIRGLEASIPRRAIVQGMAGICAQLGIRLVAEGVETRAEYEALRGCGVSLFQGYLFARPEFRALPVPAYA
ncbi:EAL domain-containing protein [Sabulicella glaciei]|uniref:EAL domain-containing protein n=1 Tax=Sabulicella glaciei TaxID=2984948 RepID=A0ABT3NZ40_9PROT|nr:EAL domain-containing protein [Roseococcus sp. MDT2-1-1]MCW8087432.1 EAL domain-containing protein [Roseococcus sp. MDT2-1-1]